MFLKLQYSLLVSLVITVSSAHNIGKIESVKFGRSLIYKRKRIELKVEPCGIPIKPGRRLEKLFPILTIWVRFVKKLSRSS